MSYLSTVEAFRFSIIMALFDTIIFFNQDVDISY